MFQFVFILVILTAIELGSAVFAMTNREEFVSTIHQVLKNKITLVIHNFRFLKNHQQHRSFEKISSQFKMFSNVVAQLNKVRNCSSKMVYVALNKFGSYSVFLITMKFCRKSTVTTELHIWYSHGENLFLLLLLPFLQSSC